jgi:hypothetical protein
MRWVSAAIILRSSPLAARSSASWFSRIAMILSFALNERVPLRPECFGLADGGRVRPFVIPAVQVDITLSVCAQLRAKSAPGDSLPDRALRGAQSNEPPSGGCLIGQPGPVSPDRPGSGAALDGRSLSSVSLALHSSVTSSPAMR